MITSKTTLKDLAGIVIAGLKKFDINATLVGGAVVSIYSDNAYQSRDLDFISPNDHASIVKAMEAMGFVRQGKNFFHQNTKFTIEFPTGPLGIGDDVPIKPEGEIETEYGKVTLLSPTQCVMDRLAWFYHHKDRQCLDQAVMVARAHPVNLSKIKKWSEREGAVERFQIFIERLKAK